MSFPIFWCPVPSQAFLFTVWQHTYMLVHVVLKTYILLSWISSFFSPGHYTFSLLFAFHSCWNSSSFTLMPPAKYQQWLMSYHLWSCSGHFFTVLSCFHKYCFSLWDVRTGVAHRLHAQTCSDDSSYILHSLLGLFCSFLWGMLQETILSSDLL